MDLEFLVRLLLATGLGSMIGLERQWHQRFASLRTNALVATGSAAFAGVALSAATNNNAAPVLSTIITGVGFLGAGVIFKEGASIRGLNTAATLWCSAAVGTLAGIDMRLQAAEVAVMVVAINLLLRVLGERVTLLQSSSPDSEMESVYRLRLVCPNKSLPVLRGFLAEQALAAGAQVRGLRHEEAPRGRARLSAELAMRGRDDHRVEVLAARIATEPGANEVHWEMLSHMPRFE